MSESTSPEPDPEDLLTRRDERPEAEALLNALKQNQDALSQLLADCDEPDGHYPEDYIYRFYSGSRKVYGLQGITEDIVGLLAQQMPGRTLNSRFADILQEGTGLQSNGGSPNAGSWRHVTFWRPIFTPAISSRWRSSMATNWSIRPASCRADGRRCCSSTTSIEPNWPSHRISARCRIQQRYSRLR